jgi:hypothetical protein
MMHKIRSAMGTRDARYQLTDMAERDEGYFKAKVKEIVTKPSSKRGKGSADVTNTMVMTVSMPVEDLETGKT